MTESTRKNMKAAALKFFASILFIAPISTAGAKAQVDPEIAKQCKDARDFQGCVKAFTTPATATETDQLTALRNAMKQVAGRLAFGTSLRDSSDAFRPVIDQLAIVESTHKDSLAVKNARLATNLFDAFQLAWEARIRSENRVFRQTGTKVYRCDVLKDTAEYFNRIYGSSVVNWTYKPGILGHACKVPDNQLPEVYMRSIINRVLREGAISPQEIAARKKAEKERRAAIEKERKLCALEPWSRYLEENPGMKAWATANPSLAEQKKKEIVEDPESIKRCDKYSQFPTQFDINPASVWQ